MAEMIFIAMLALQTASQQPDKPTPAVSRWYVTSSCAHWNRNREEDGAERVADVAWIKQLVSRPEAPADATLTKVVGTLDERCARYPEMGLWGWIFFGIAVSCSRKTLSRTARRMSAFHPKRTSAYRVAIVAP